ncbi:MAG: alpha/beta hydrolase fold domain-containing protein [Pseudomonadota bacterium]
MTDAYDLDAGRPETQARQTALERASDAVAAQPGAVLGLAYGAHPRQRIDVFPAAPDAPIFVFFHGGYWRAGSREARRFPAPAWRARGVTWAVAGYRLVTDAPLAASVADARAAIAFLAQQRDALGLGAAPLHLCGNSAGGHLAAMAAAAGWDGRPDIASLTTLSGLHDLRPLVRCNPNAWLKLTDGRAAELSPILHLPPTDLPVLVGWGGAETAAFIAQSELYAAMLKAAGNPAATVVSPGEDHFEVIAGLGAEAHPIFQAMREMVSR